MCDIQDTEAMSSSSLSILLWLFHHILHVLWIIELNITFSLRQLDFIKNEEHKSVKQIIKRQTEIKRTESTKEITAIIIKKKVILKLQNEIGRHYF